MCVKYLFYSQSVYHEYNISGGNRKHGITIIRFPADRGKFDLVTFFWHLKSGNMKSNCSVPAYISFILFYYMLRCYTVVYDSPNNYDNVIFMKNHLFIGRGNS